MGFTGQEFGQGTEDYLSLTTLIRASYEKTQVSEQSGDFLTQMSGSAGPLSTYLSFSYMMAGGF